MSYRFGPFVADPVVYRVSRGGVAVELTPKLLDLLFYLLERPAALVTKEDLLGGVWPGANVTDNALAQAVSELRDALDDTPASPTYILTVARRGYRFIAPVTVDAAAPAPATPEHPAAPTQTGGARAIGVLDFVNLSGDAEVAWLSAGIAETVTNDLAALRMFRVIDRWRLVAATRLAGPSLHDIAVQLGLPLLVTGSYQRNHAHLRITARVVDVERGEAVADAKLDGSLDDLFALQDGIVQAFAREMGVGASFAGRLRPRETSSLDAYRAATEGWLKIETLDTGLIDASIADFERAIALDPDYAAAYTGLATAESVAYETTRTARDPNAAALRIGHRARDARHSPRRASRRGAFDPVVPVDERVGVRRRARGGAQGCRARSRQLATPLPAGPRLLGGAAPSGAGARTRALSPVRLRDVRDRDAADRARRPRWRGASRAAGRARPGPAGGLGFRFPAIGFHWMLGAIEAAAARHPAAIRSFERELEQADARRMYGPEYAAAALVGRGFSELALDRPADAVESFRDAARHVPGLVRADIGEACALDRLGRTAEGRDAWARAAESRAHLSASGRAPDALMAAASERALQGDAGEAITCLESLLGGPRPSRLGWQLPIEPSYAPLRGTAGWPQLMATLGERAR